jgi:transposase-like protein
VKNKTTHQGKPISIKEDKKYCCQCTLKTEGEYIKSSDGLKQRFYCHSCIERLSLKTKSSDAAFAVPLCFSGDSGYRPHQRRGVLGCG